MRIEKAKEILLSDPKASVSGVIERCGFSDCSYFISIFKKIVGSTHKKYIVKNMGRSKVWADSPIPLQ